MATRKIFNVKSVKNKKYNTLDIGMYNEWFGTPEGQFVAMMYGESGSGKSVTARYLNKPFNKVLFSPQGSLKQGTLF